jgi:hydroxymethylbilane synthase
VTALRLGTRGSALALAQARSVAALLPEPVELVKITTAGDVDRLHGDKSRWVGALEAALLDGSIDLAVHSAKDVPGEIAAGTEIVATPRRAEPFDAVVGDLREGARVGTSALRRRAQLLAAHPGVTVVDLRGNVDTRLKKREAGEVDTLVLAAAGLDRLGRRADADSLLIGGVFVPAPGQGVIAVQGRVGSEAAAVAAAADHPQTHAELDDERHVVRALGASCHTPVGVLSLERRVRAFVGLPDGAEYIVEEAATADGLARRLLAAGADELLQAAEEVAR